jgi:hypothetical protein
MRPETDPRLYAASLLERHADRLWQKSEELLADSAELRGQAIAMRRLVEIEQEVALFQQQADDELSERRRRRA